MVEFCCCELADMCRSRHQLGVEGIRGISGCAAPSIFHYIHDESPSSVSQMGTLVFELVTHLKTTIRHFQGLLIAERLRSTNRVKREVCHLTTPSRSIQNIILCAFTPLVVVAFITHCSSSSTSLAYSVIESVACISIVVAYDNRPISVTLTSC